MNAQVHARAGVLPDLRILVDSRIEAVLAPIEPRVLREAMEHALAGGKRVRPLLAMLACAAAGGRSADALDAGVALELLHTSSLIHDDIMDGSDVRRGRATVHVAYDHSTAILAGDAMIALAFRTLHGIPSVRRDRLWGLFSSAFVHLCEGQGEDLAFARAEGVTSPEHQRMVEKKTARLLEASAAMGAALGTINESVIRSFGRFGLYLGLAYQAKDDILDETGTEEAVGKSVGIDRRNGRKTFLTLVRPEVDTLGGVEALVGEYTGVACAALEHLPCTREREYLLEMARSLAGRNS
jgi:geranylgeranyl diphosphate synthase, type II